MLEESPFSDFGRPISNVVQSQPAAGREVGQLEAGRLGTGRLRPGAEGWAERKIQSFQDGDCVLRLASQ